MQDEDAGLSQIRRQLSAVQLNQQSDTKQENTPSKFAGTPFVTPDTSPVHGGGLGAEFIFQQMELPINMTPYIIVPGQSSGSDSSVVGQSGAEDTLCPDPLDQSPSNPGVDCLDDSSLYQNSPCQDSSYQDSDNESLLNRSGALGPADVHCSVQ